MLDLLALRRHTQFVQCLGFDLADPLLRHPQCNPYLMKRLGLASTIQTEAADDNLLLPLVKVRQDAANLPGTQLLRDFL